MQLEVCHAPADKAVGAHKVVVGKCLPIIGFGHDLGEPDDTFKMVFQNYCPFGIAGKSSA